MDFQAYIKGKNSFWRIKMDKISLHKPNTFAMDETQDQIGCLSPMI